MKNRWRQTYTQEDDDDWVHCLLGVVVFIIPLALRYFTINGTEVIVTNARIGRSILWSI